MPQSPVTAARNQFEAPTTPVDEKCPTVESANSSPQVLDKPEQNRFEAVFQVPSKPIDVPSSSKHNRQPPQRSDSETSSIHMEVDEASGTAEKTAGNTDIDSGIENMEVSVFGGFIFVLLVTAKTKKYLLFLVLFCFIAFITVL